MRPLYVILFFFTLFTSSCQHENTTPRPKAFPRITLCDTIYSVVNVGGIDLSVNNQAKVEIHENSEFLDIIYPTYNAKVTMTLKKLKSGDDEEINAILSHINERRSLNIGENIAVEKRWKTTSGNRWNLSCFEVAGDCTTPLMFEVIDKEKKYLPFGTLFFNDIVSYDSIYPVIEAVEYDIMKMFGISHNSTDI